MKRLILIAIVTASAFAAAIGPQTVWEVRLTNGLSANGGGFDIGAANLATIAGSTNATPIVLTVSSTAGMTTGELFCVSGHTGNTAANGCWVGTVSGSTISLAGTVGNGVGGAAGVVGDDRSQSNAAAFSGATATTDGAGVLSSGTHGFVQADVGNFINLQSCSGGTLTAGIYEVIGVAANAATLNVSPGLSLTGCTWAEGGAIKVLRGTTGAAFTLATNMVSQNRAFVKAESGQTTAENQTFSQVTVPFTAGTNANRITGYVTSRTETQSAANRATLTLSLGASTGFALSNMGWILENFTINCAGLSSTTGISFGNSHGQAVNVRVTNCVTNAVSSASSTGIAVLASEIDHNAGPATMGSKGTLRGSYIHDNTAAPAVDASVGGVTIERNVFYNNSGAAADTLNAQEASVLYNAFYKCGRHCISLATFFRSLVKGNLLVNGGATASGCGLYFGSATPIGANFAWDGNAYYNNSGGNRCSMDDPNGIGNKQDAIAPYTNTQDVVMSGNPWTAPDSGDFSLNATAGAGAAVRAASPPAIPALTTVNRLDFGPFQHLDAGGGGGGGQRSYTYAK